MSPFYVVVRVAEIVVSEMGGSGHRGHTRAKISVFALNKAKMDQIGPHSCLDGN